MTINRLSLYIYIYTTILQRWYNWTTQSRYVSTDANLFYELQPLHTCVYHNRDRDPYIAHLLSLFLLQRGSYIKFTIRKEKEKEKKTFAKSTPLPPSISLHHQIPVHEEEIHDENKSWLVHRMDRQIRSSSYSVNRVIGPEQRGSGGGRGEVRTRHPVALCSVVRIMHSVETLHRRDVFHPRKWFAISARRGGEDGIERLKQGGGCAYSPYGPYYESNTHLARWYTLFLPPLLSLLALPCVFFPRPIYPRVRKDPPPSWRDAAIKHIR